MDEAEIAVGGFVVAGGQPSGIFELVEAALDHVAQGMIAGSTGSWIRRLRLVGIIATPPRLSISSRMKSAS